MLYAISLALYAASIVVLLNITAGKLGSHLWWPAAIAGFCALFIAPWGSLGIIGGTAFGWLAGATQENALQRKRDTARAASQP